MAVFRLALVVFGFAVVNSFPSGDVVFPEDENGVDAPVSGHERFHHGYTPGPPRDQGFHQRGPGHYRPGPHSPGSAPPREFGPSFSRPTEEARGTRPFQNSQPQNFPGPVSSLDFRPQEPRPFEKPSRVPNQESPEGASRPNQNSQPQNFPGPAPSSVYNRPQESIPFGNPDQVPNQESPVGVAQSFSDLFTETTNSQTPGAFQPDFIEIGSSEGSFEPGLGGSFSSNPDPTTPSTVETTTKIPRRDPTNRIVYTVACPCIHTFQYTPVCGTDGQTYGNMGVLQCAQKCGSAVKVFLEGSCGRNNGHPGAISLKY